MVKGFIFFRDGKIPFVIENYRMELFTDDSLLDDFCKEYNFKENYILHGQCFDIGIRGRKATFLVENSIGSTCYLRCYTINMFDKDEEYDSIGLQSPSLDEVFRCEYEYIDMVRAGINLAIEPKVVYKVPFGMNDQKYELEFRIGHDNRLGLLEDLDRKCELILPLHTNEIQECYDITNVLHNLIKKKRDKLKADIAAQTRNLREANGSIKQFIQEDLKNLAEELRETERQLSKLDEGRKNNMIAIRDLEMTKERLLSFAEYAKDAQPEVLVTLIQTIVERIYIVDKDDERYCHIFIKGCSGEDYTGFFQTAGYIEQNTVPVCDSEQYCICTKISETSNIWTDSDRYREHPKKTVRV